VVSNPDRNLGVAMNFDLKDREIKLIYLLIFLIIVVGVFKIVGTLSPQTANAKEELVAKSLEKDRLLLKAEELDEMIAKNSFLQSQLEGLKDRFILEAEDAAFVMSEGQGEEILIKSITPKDVFPSEFYFTNSYIIEIQGMYPDIVRFIAGLERKPVSRVVAVNLELNHQQMNVQGTIAWEMYTLNERNVAIIPAVSIEHGRADPFKVPDEYLGFVFAEEIDEVNQKIHDSNEIYEDNTSENQEEVPFIYENSYKFPIKQ